MKKNSIFYLPHYIKSLGDAWRGLASTYKSEPSFRLELITTIILFPVALIVGDTVAKQALLIGSLLIILLAELVNTAIETIVNRISYYHHHLSGKAKDIGAAIVLIAIVNAIIIWILILKKYIF